MRTGVSPLAVRQTRTALFVAYILGSVATASVIDTLATASAEELPAANFQKEIRPLLETHCFQCHGSKTQKGDINFTLLSDESTALRYRKTIRKAVEQLEAEEMPPEGEKQLTAPERERLLGWLKQMADRMDGYAKGERDPGPSPVRRLNLAEYNLTIRDLVGIDFDAAEAVGMPDDGGGPGYGKLAAALTVSPALVEKYFAAADKVLDRLYGTELSSAVDGAVTDRAKKAREKLFGSATRKIANDKASSERDSDIATTARDSTERDAASKLIRQFAGRAFRRPATTQEVADLLKLYDRSAAKGGAYAESVRAMLKSVLVSPNFLFRIEQDQARDKSAAACHVRDEDLAVRLSYFLWCSIPDDALLELGAEHKLSDPKTLESQVRRMLADPRSGSLTEQFAAQWLQIRKLRDARPSTEFFPTFTQDLRKAMYDETATYFDKIRVEDRSVLELIDSDYTYLNGPLAQHYGIPGVEGPAMRRVRLKPEFHRGGLLGMGSVLALTSHTFRTSPTKRGKWILEVVFGTPPPPPPANAGVLKEDSDKKKAVKTFRELLARHAGQTACAACHKKMDPLGFALENFDAVGAWRDKAGDEPLDTSGELPSGEKFNGFVELKEILRRRRNQFVCNMTEQMMIYALGRELDYYDDGEIQKITSDLERNDYKFSRMVMGIVESYPFQYRRNSDARGTEISEKEGFKR
jgi:mono/diheme cytochrome c family protein